MAALAYTGSLQVSPFMGFCTNRNQIQRHIYCRPKDAARGSSKLELLRTGSSWRGVDSRRSPLSVTINKPIQIFPYRYNAFKCKALFGSGVNVSIPSVTTAAGALTRSIQATQSIPFINKAVPAVGIILFAIWGLAPVVQIARNLFARKNGSGWTKSTTNFLITSYLQPILLWTGVTLICRALDPIAMSSEASQLVKHRLLTFVKSLSTVLAVAYCLSGVILQAQKFFMETTNDPTDARNMGFQFAGKAVYTAVWVAAAALFMELLGFSTQKWLTAGGLGTVLLTLAGREIFTNFLSSAMIHATRPFVVNEWIQTKIEGYDVSGTVEHVGWWSPTIIRGEDREAVHIPNHKFTVNVVRNLSQKTHWRIKTHLAISHLDVNKINNIVADMRKVLAKNPQVEQQKLHRRVFLENINPENQALLILISCFVKTSHFEEYLCVKEAILLDLLRVIRHHRARLATPIRTIQKTYIDAEMDNAPFGFTRGAAASNRPFLLLEPPYKINGEDKTRVQSRSTRSNTDQDKQASGQPISDREPDSKVNGTPISEMDAQEESKSGTRSEPKEVETPDKVLSGSTIAATPSVSEPKLPDKVMASSSSKAPPVKGKVSADLLSSDAKGSSSSPVINKKPSLENPQTTGEVESPVLSEKNSEDLDSSLGSSQSKQSPGTPPPKSRPNLEENIVLGVALEGSKRTLPIEEEPAPAPTPTPATTPATTAATAPVPASAPAEAKEGSGRPSGGGTTTTDKGEKSS